MYPPIFEICAADPNVQTNFGVSPTRVYPFGEAGKSPVKPYCVWQQIGGDPEFCISDVPDIDRFSIQVDIYADSGDAARDAAKAIRDALDPYGNVSYEGDGRDPDTDNYRYSLSVELYVERDSVS